GAQRRRARAEQHRGRRHGLHRCRRQFADLCAVFHVQGIEPAPRQLGAPRSRGQRLELNAAAVFAASDFVRLACERDVALLAALQAPGELGGCLERADYVERGEQALHTGVPLAEAALLSALRRWRRYEMVRIAWRDLAGIADVDSTLAEVSAFADAAIAL